MLDNKQFGKWTVLKEVPIIKNRFEHPWLFILFLVAVVAMLVTSTILLIRP